jgi:hypothetical protein
MYTLFIAEDDGKAEVTPAKPGRFCISVRESNPFGCVLSLEMPRAILETVINDARALLDAEDTKEKAA